MTVAGVKDFLARLLLLTIGLTRKSNLKSYYNGTGIPQTHYISPASFLFISFKNVLFHRRNLKSKIGFFKPFAIFH